LNEAEFLWGVFLIYPFVLRGPVVQQIVCEAARKPNIEGDRVLEVGYGDDSLEDAHAFVGPYLLSISADQVQGSHWWGVDKANDSPALFYVEGVPGVERFAYYTWRHNFSGMSNGSRDLF